MNHGPHGRLPVLLLVGAAAWLATSAGEEITETIQTGAPAAVPAPFHAVGIDGTGQRLMVLDNGAMMDAGDLSDTRTAAGAAGPAHRKFIVYEPTDQFGGQGDLSGCDAPAQGGFTHGHAVTAVAVGNATHVAPGTYGGTWGTPGNRALDGVAPGARVVFYDAHVTTAGVCGDPMQGWVSPGNLYDPPCGGSSSSSLCRALSDHGTVITNFSWGSGSNAYDASSFDIDWFLHDEPEAMVFIAAGNSGSISAPATAKNGVAVGASYTNEPAGNEENRWAGSAVGPAASAGRIAPLLMAPGADVAGPASRSAASCRTSDNDQADPVECILSEGVEGTGYATAAASGAALLIRDYFAQGFHPDGTSADADNAADQVPTISGALIKALMIASADWMSGSNLTDDYRFNNEQGYGRITLRHALPLADVPGLVPGSLRVHDAGIPGGVSDFPGLPETLDAVAFDFATTTFDVCGVADEVRIALTWMDTAGDALANELHLELESPGGKLYYGNYFTDDNDRNGVIDPATEDCPGIDGTTGARDAGPWSLPICVNARHDRTNPTEAIFLSADADGNGDELPPFNQLETGTWTLTIIANDGGNNAFQRYALAVVGACEAVPPEVEAVRPLDGTPAAYVRTKVYVTFTEAVDGATVDSGTVRLLGPGGTPVPAAVSLLAHDRAVLDPDATLAAGTTYTVQVTENVRDLAGNRAVPFSSVFTTETSGRERFPIESVSFTSSGLRGARSGASLAPAGDLDQDGLRDLLAGAPSFDHAGREDAGAVLVYLGSDDAEQLARPDLIFTGIDAHDQTGVSVAGDFDFNGDGFRDIAIGAEQQDLSGALPAATGPGKVYVIYFNPALFPGLGDPDVTLQVDLARVGADIPGVILEGETTGDRAGLAVATGGPVSAGALYDTVAVGAPGRSSERGRVYVVFGDPALGGTRSLGEIRTGALAGALYFGDFPGDALGASVAFVGDLTGDGWPELAMGAPGADPLPDCLSGCGCNGEFGSIADAGIVYVAHGPISPGPQNVCDLGGFSPLTTAIPGTQILGHSAGMRLGYDVDGGVDHALDGMPDLAMGAPGFSNAEGVDRGAVFQTSEWLPDGIFDTGDIETGARRGVCYVGAAGAQAGWAVSFSPDPPPGGGSPRLGIVEPTGQSATEGRFSVMAVQDPLRDCFPFCCVPTDTGGGSADCEMCLNDICELSTLDKECNSFDMSLKPMDGGGGGESATDSHEGGTVRVIAVSAPTCDKVTRDCDDKDGEGEIHFIIEDEPQLNDADGDGVRDGLDCVPADATLWSLPGEVRDLRLSDAAGTTTLSWTGPAEPGGASVLYDTIRSGDASDFSAAAVCVESDDGTDTSSTDTDPLGPGGLFFYLIRAENGCAPNRGALGKDPIGLERVARACP